MRANLEGIIAYAVRQRLIKSKPEWMQRTGEDIASPIPLPVPARDNGSGQRISGEINHQSNLPGSELPDRGKPMAGCLERERHADRVAFADGPLVD